MWKPALLFILILGLTGCAKPPAPVPTHVHQTAPFGVFDIQSGHGHGQWRHSANQLVR